MSDKQLNEAILLEDAKHKIKEQFSSENLSNNNDFDLLMRSFVYHLETNTNAKDYEDKEFAHEIYKVLGWDDNNYFDVINSFWTTFHQAWCISGYPYKDASKKSFTQNYVNENDEQDELHKKNRNHERGISA